MWLPLHRRPSFAYKKRPRRPQVTSAADDLSSFFLSQPKTEKLDVENTRIAGLEIGHAAMQGLRVHMEDRHIISPMALPEHILLAVFDGHAGTLVAQHASQHLLSHIESTAQWTKYAALAPHLRGGAEAVDLLSAALVQAFVDLDGALRGSLVAEGGALLNESGCAAVAALVTPSHTICANLGDSRCVLGTADKVVAMSDDHKPELPLEQKRIEAAAGFVMWNRVNGQLAMSRALGDFGYKLNEQLADHEQLVIAYPDICVQPRGTSDEVLLLACDGVWDVCSNDEAVSFVTAKLLAEPLSSCQAAAEALIDWALERESTDNISALVLRFPGLRSSTAEEVQDKEVDKEVPKAKRARKA